VEQGRRAQIEDLVKNGVEVNIDVNTGDYDSRTALHLAASEGYVDVVESLLALNANVNATDRMGFSPLVAGPHTMLALSTECLEGEGH
jgi:ankyrin repeat protein